ncbi:MAG: mycofactocin biosynthesis chaperone MftB [Thermogemmatispora sp.]|uniref:mycofactocin biosynthesis chaperone MftB n=1 Tax=Thermogemmatispora sp. TaxID=1968838 RepID=UPI002614861E|nr:mycofactocin biosynthesis chaperone MftB [Thermogemmatispora sp.]MBX5456130.1 mycofactocin biosynthesis chaperone MftB [Thermogemmatispora sp.]
MTMTAHSAGYRYRLLPEVKIRREAFGGILYKYGCADRGTLSFVNSPHLIDLLLLAREQFAGDLSAAIEQRVSSARSRARLLAALDELRKRGYLEAEVVANKAAPEATAAE